MSKATKYATNGAIIGGIGNGMINVINQWFNIYSYPETKFDWASMLKAIGKGSLIGGSVGLIAGAVVDYQNSLEKPINTDALLLAFADGVKLNMHDVSYMELNRKAEDLILLLKSLFGEKLVGEPMKIGSSEKGTALREAFDIDISFSFKPDSFSSTKKMMNCVYSALEDNMASLAIARLRQQTKSVGVFFEIEGAELKIDVVPCKLSVGNKTSGYLHLGAQGFWGNDSTFTKTDFNVLKGLKLTKTQKDVVVLLKSWKRKHDLPLSSHLLERLVLKAYEKNTVPKGLTKKIIMVLKYIQDNLGSVVIRGFENTNNILTDISEGDKSLIIRACNDAIEEYQYQPNSIFNIVS